MFSFEGDYKRTPLQRLGGVSTTNGIDIFSCFACYNGGFQLFNLAIRCGFRCFGCRQGDVDQTSATGTTEAGRSPKAEYRCRHHTVVCT